MDRKRMPRLVDLCLTAAAEGFRKGCYTECKTLVKSEFGQRLFDMLHTPHIPMTKELVEQIGKKLSFSRVVLGSHNIDDIHRDLTFYHTREELEILDLSTNLYYLDLNFPTPRNPKRPHRVEMFPILQVFLKNITALKKLRIGGCDQINFCGNWSLRMFPELPAITHLNLNSCPVTNSDLFNICKCSQKLIELDIGQTEVDNLDGFEMLKFLKKLSIMGLKFKTADNVANISRLVNLEVLDISSNSQPNRGNTAQLLESITLPNLTVLDCSENELSVESMKKLIGNFPNLEEVSVIRTGLTWQNIEQNQLDDKVKFYTEKNLKSCCESLKFHESNPATSKLILGSIFRSLVCRRRSHYQAECIPVLTQCLIDVGKNHYQTFRNRAEVIRCFDQILRNDTVFGMLTMNVKTDIVRVTCTIVEMAEVDGVSKLPLHSAIIGLKYFEDTSILEDTKLYGLVCNVYMKVLNAMDRSTITLDDYFLGKICSFLGKHMGSKKNVEYVKNSLILDVKLKIEMAASNNKDYWLEGAVFNFLRVIFKIPHTFSSPGGLLKFIVMNRKYEDHIYFSLNASDFEESTVQNGYKCLQLIGSSKGEKQNREFFNRKIIHFIECLKTREMTCKTVVIKYLFDEFKMNTDKEHYKPYTNEEMRALQSELLELMEKHEDSCIQDFFEHVANNTSVNGVRNFAQWICQNLPVEPPSPRDEPPALISPTTTMYSEDEIVVIRSPFFHN